MTTKILTGDCRTMLKTLPDESVNCCITSPPYFGLRDYNVTGQLGLEKSPEEYIGILVSVFQEVRRVLKKDGTVWLNIGDSYAGSWGNYGGVNRGAGKQRHIHAGSRVENESWDERTKFLPPAAKGFPGIKKKDLIGIPWMLAFALRADGWRLRQDIIWHKPNPMPESVEDRCTKAHEYIFLLSKSDKYYYDQDAIKTEAKDAEDDARRIMQQQDDFKSAPSDQKNGIRKRKMPDGWATHKGAHGGFHKHGREKGAAKDYDGSKANLRSVWTIATRPFKEAHFATFPPALIVPCIKAGCPEGGMVLDPFLGAGTTGLVCDRLGRNCIGIELNLDYAKMAAKRIKGDAPLFADVESA